MGKLTRDELEDLARARNTPLWDITIEGIKINHGGEWPSDWHEKVIAGLMSDTKIEITVHKTRRSVGVPWE